ncbi:UDP-N-acetylmuramate:L-alanyl-gamma-D-glutamyl-meso-diaminopimelate ligase [candidate division KSB1 bacterium]|nr:UDP-N-acetylmuramate:L-alanyl-gamma-D-glutamyl-meso-diaminopimelate ligase [candidate division KSB1 bacterium]NIR68474.1 UDP-N-acetylmuramate:L-alanyl-gamma-D-glutamyl-meso-diaminopimelate ligase [candidate division KSB1 bacterium]NIS25125.1 UDP-N-acetylmuramate:L-alanyl-gamma-D-glutamyl-meso-diaminopimelate ligase [candidate division KSB1 bacterium]NIT72037.1 UDP-N-acetylmuramate:L-alanyl-gamma-D-glutamyl-meso-diaminopimelate ligase [candidate division KSB1 bacterium]NIU25824.1 UDP-N-acetyl
MPNTGPDSIKDIYFIAICGTGMTALAGMLKSQGYEVRGSDENVYPPMSTFLADLGILVHNGFSEDHLEPAPDLVVIGNSMSRGNPEVEAVLERKINYTSLPLALKEFFIRSQYSCVVAGTHGKTTTASLLAWILEKSGKDPGFFIGGIPENFGQGFKLGKGEIFVSEGDEYDSAFFDKGSKFLHYMPDLVILNNIEYDHVDIFKSMDDVKTTFSRLINLIPRNGVLIVNWDDPVVRELSTKAFSKVVGFGLNEEAHWHASNIEMTENRTEFDVYHKGEFFGRFSIPLYGTHMVQNCLGVIAGSTALGISEKEIMDGLTSFKNVRRRLQFIGEANNIKVFDDFAHHPTEVKATLTGLKSRFPGRRFWAIFEPRTATSKRKLYEEAYTNGFEIADRVILTPPHKPEKVPAHERLSVERISSTLRDRDKPNWIFSPNSDMLDFLKENLEANDVVLFMSNGDFNQIPRKLINVL